MKIYILSCYEEDGADDVYATTDRDEFIVGAEKYIRAVVHKDFVEDEVSRFKKLMSRSDEELCLEQKHGLSHGWGGPQVHVVEANKLPSFSQ